MFFLATALYTVIYFVDKLIMVDLGKRRHPPYFVRENVVQRAKIGNPSLSSSDHQFEISPLDKFSQLVSRKIWRMTSRYECYLIMGL